MGHLPGPQNIGRRPSGRQPSVACPRPKEAPPTSWSTGGGRSYLPELSIKNYDLWLEWQAHQLDMPHWWEELTTIPEVGNVKKLAWKIHVSFDIPAVQCEALRNQDCTVLLHPSASRGVCSSPMTPATKMSS